MPLNISDGALKEKKQDSPNCPTLTSFVSVRDALVNRGENKEEEAPSCLSSVNALC